MFVSSNLTWGGSERLWTEAAVALHARGHRVRAYAAWSRSTKPDRDRLRKLGVRVHLLVPPFLGGSLFKLIAVQLGLTLRLYAVVRLWLALALRPRPDLIVISQGGNYDGVMLAAVCLALRLPYVLLSHKASEGHWPSDTFHPLMRRAYLGARWRFFVAEHNRRVTERQLGLFLESWSIVRNPYSADWHRRGDWSAAAPCALACVARLDIHDKGQDILLQVLASEKWRARPLTVTFVGEGAHTGSLRALAAMLRLTSVTFAGQTDDIGAVWAAHSGLILSSRNEGIPLAIVEAMMNDRIAIVTAAGGNAEIVEDGVTGFVAAAPTCSALDDALERAWSCCSEWQALGKVAGDRIRSLIGADPAAAFAEILVGLAAADRGFVAGKDAARDVA